MSKMSNLYLVLSEQAAELGFESLEDAMAHGHRPNYETQRLEPPVVQPELDAIHEQELAHDAWVNERSDVLNRLRSGVEVLERHNYFYEADTMKKAIEFIEEGEH